MHSAKNNPINQHYLCIYTSRRTYSDVSNIRNDVIQYFMINESFEISIAGQKSYEREKWR